jgi:hypothetical protein
MQKEPLSKRQLMRLDSGLSRCRNGAPAAAAGVKVRPGVRRWPAGQAVVSATVGESRAARIAG